MDTRSPTGLATLVALGAAGAGVGTLLAVLVYAVCARRRILLGVAGGPLNWFEKDLLDRTKPARSKEVLVGLGVGVSGSDDKVWAQNLSKDNLALDYSGALSLSESCAEEESAQNSPASSFGPAILQQPPLPGGPIAASDKLVVIAAKPRTISSMHTRLDHTKIDTALYQEPVNVEEDSPTDIENSRGEIKFSLFYDPAAGILNVRLLEAHDLQARELSGTADPYAKIRLLPDRSNVWQTRIHKRTLNPVFDEDFVFEVHPSVAVKRTLEFLIYDFDAFSRHHSIGSVQLPLGSIDLGSRGTITRHIIRCTERDTRAELGELMVSMSFLPSAARLTVIVIKARNLRVVDETRTSSDPYVKVSVLSEDGKRLKKRKSCVQRNTTNPVWNEALTFDLGKELLSKCSIEFLILHDSLLGSSETLARSIVSGKCQRDLFHEVLAGRGATAQWLPLAETRQS